MVRVLSVLHGNTFGGPHNRNLRIAPVLRERYGVDLVILMPQEPGNAPARLRDAGLDVLEVPIPRLRKKLDPRYHFGFLSGFMRSVGAIRAVLDEHRIDVVQINGISNPHAAVAARRAGVPVVWQMLDTFPPPLFLGLMMPYVRHTAGALMSTGLKVAEAHPGALAAADRLVLFHPPVDIAEFAAVPEGRRSARERLGLDPDGLVIGKVSNLNPQKGHRTFVRAAARLKSARPDATFVMLGRRYADHEAYIQSMLAEAASLGLRLDQDLIVVDPEDQVAALSMAFDVFWMTPEPRSEGIPTVIEEAMALGLPVVAADVGSISEIVRDGETGRVVLPQDPEAVCRATLELLANPELRRAMSERAVAFARTNFPVERCAEQHARAYGIALGNDLVGQRGGSLHVAESV